MKKTLLYPIVLSASLIFSMNTAQAAILDFNFNALADGNNNTKVQTYMRNIITALHPGGTVTVTGSKAEANYTGDGHVVGPISGSVVIPYTLGRTDGGVYHNGAYDSYLVNSGSDRITMTFSFPIYSFSFDYEIFPDGTCPKASTSCTPTSANWPDFKLEVDDVQQFRTLAIDPSVSGPYNRSPNSGLSKIEKAPQFLGVSGELFFANGVTKLEFIDWPRMIGIDNLKINDQKPSTVVPEPTTLLLLSSGLLGFLGFKRKTAA